MHACLGWSQCRCWCCCADRERLLSLGMRCCRPRPLAAAGDWALRIWVCSRPGARPRMPSWEAGGVCCSAAWNSCMCPGTPLCTCSPAAPQATRFSHHVSVVF